MSDSPRRRRRAASAALAVLLVALSVLTGRLFIWPELPPLPDVADVVVQLGGPGDRRDVALDLVRARRAPLVAISVSPQEAWTSWCEKGRLDGVPVLCFQPEPATTRGEARSIADLAERHGWRSAILVTTRDQAWRATVRVSRCWDGQLFVATAPLPWYRWPDQILHQLGGTAKAFTFETSC